MSLKRTVTYVQMSSTDKKKTFEVNYINFENEDKDIDLTKSKLTIR